MQVAPQDYQHVPIDIQTGKLLDWLQDRRHCGRRWQAQLQRVRERLQGALRDLPEHPEIRAVLGAAPLHYFHCLRILEILRGTEAGSKNLFGRYSSQRMKDWQEVVSLYEQENVYLAELGSLLWRGVSYEAPALRRQLWRCQQAQQELARRQDECQLGAAQLRQRFLDSCRQYGIDGQDVRRELLAQVQALPSLLSRVGDGASALGEAIELYQACVAFVCDSPGAAELPLLRFVAEHGNCSVFRWRTGREPLRLERPELREEPPEPPRQDTIDWGDFPAEPPQGGDIDWGITLEPSAQGDPDGEKGQEGTEPAEPSAQGDGGIDWGDGEKGQEGTMPAEPSAQGDGGIDWGDGEKGQEGTITVLEAGAEAPEGVARGADALTLLENPETRNQFMDELMELELFLAQRLLELQEEADVVAISQLQLAPAPLQGQSAPRLREQLGTARALLAQLCSPSLQHLCMILASPRPCRVTQVAQVTVVAISQLQLAPAPLQGQSAPRLREQLGTARALLAQLCSPSLQHLCMILASPRPCRVTQVAQVTVVAISQLQLAPAPLQGQSAPRLREQLGTARALLAQLCSPSLQHLCMILASPRYVERVSALLRQKLLQAELLLAKREALGQRRQRALAEQAELEPKLQRLQEQIKELQKLIEADISKRYGGRPVNLMGINV